MRVAIFLGCMKNAHIYHICTGHRSSWTCANRFGSDVGQDTMFIIHAQRVRQTTYAQAAVERRNMAICRLLNNNTSLLQYHCSLLSSASCDLFYLFVVSRTRAVYLPVCFMATTPLWLLRQLQVSCIILSTVEGTRPDTAVVQSTWAGHAVHVCLPRCHEYNPANSHVLNMQTMLASG